MISHQPVHDSAYFDLYIKQIHLILVEILIILDLH
jgi:hypothetical protein